MNFDESVDKILKEAYFSSPYEKMTGIKRQVNILPEGDGSEFRETKNRKLQAMEQAAERELVQWDDADEAGRPMSKKELADLSIRELAQLEGRMAGDEYNLDDIKRYFEAIGAFTTGKPPMSAERYRNIEKQAKAKVGDLVKKAEVEGDPEEHQDEPDRVAPDPDKLTGFARAKALAQGIDMSKYR